MRTVRCEGNSFFDLIVWKRFFNSPLIKHITSPFLPTPAPLVCWYWLSVCYIVRPTLLSSSYFLPPTLSSLSFTHSSLFFTSFLLLSFLLPSFLPSLFLPSFSRPVHYFKSSFPILFVTLPSSHFYLSTATEAYYCTSIHLCIKHKTHTPDSSTCPNDNHCVRSSVDSSHHCVRSRFNISCQTC